MKKYQLIEKAMLDYPKGTKFIGAYEKEFESSGSFRINHKGNVLNNEYGLICDLETDKWSEIIKDEPLKVEKIAVAINNHRECGLIEKVAKLKGHAHNINLKFPWYMCLDDSGIYLDTEHASEGGYKIIDFYFWAAQNNVEVLKPILTSEDGVELFEGDKLFEVNKRWNSDTWYIVDADNGKGYWTVKAEASKWSMGENEGYVSKAFSTKEAALAWIEEQNKPKEIRLHLDSKVPAIVKKDQVLLDYSKNLYIQILGKELEEIYAAYKSLQ